MLSRRRRCDARQHVASTFRFCTEQKRRRYRLHVHGTTGTTAGRSCAVEADGERARASTTSPKLWKALWRDWSVVSQDRLPMKSLAESSPMVADAVEREVPRKRGQLSRGFFCFAAAFPFPGIWIRRLEFCLVSRAHGTRKKKGRKWRGREDRRRKSRSTGAITLQRCPPTPLRRRASARLERCDPFSPSRASSGLARRAWHRSSLGVAPSEQWLPGSFRAAGWSLQRR